RRHGLRQGHRRGPARGSTGRPGRHEGLRRNHSRRKARVMKTNQRVRRARRLTAITAAGMSAALVLAGCDASATGTDGSLVLGGVFSKSPVPFGNDAEETDRKSTRLNSSHVSISYAVFCLKQKTNGHEKQNDE